MRRITVIAYIAAFLILAVNALFYRSLYNHQIEYISKMLDRQARIVGTEMEQTSQMLIPDLAEMNFGDNISEFFSASEVNDRALEKIELYYSKYEDLIVSLKLNDNKGNVFTLLKDQEKNTWINGRYKAQIQPAIFDKEKVEPVRENFEYYFPVMKGGELLGNFVVTINFDQYFTRIFSKYSIEDYQWQWVINSDGNIIYDTHKGKPGYSETKRLTKEVNDGVSGRLFHTIDSDGKSKKILSSFFPVNIIGKSFGIVFSAPTDFFQKYIVRNSTIIVLITLLIVLAIIHIYRIIFKRQNKKMIETRNSEATLIKMIEEMPVGIVVYNQNREILKANRIAAQLFSRDSETEMLGMLIPDLSRNEYVSDLSGQFGQGKIIKINAIHGDRIVFRGSIPIDFKGEDATLESYIDITALEAARKHEAEANIAKSELLARMSFEIRTPLNGIIGMTEMLCRSNLPPESKEVSGLLRRSTDLLLNIITDIFDVSKVETGKMFLDQIPFKVRDEITYCINMIMRDNPDTRVELIQDVAPTVPDNVIGDPYRLRQILSNLLFNSLSTNLEGEIKLSCRLKSAINNVITLEFTIADTGRVYTKTEIKKLFGDYITNKGMRSEWSEELRLGPILARQLVELMGGELNAVSPAFVDSSRQDRGLKITFNIQVHLNEKIVKEIDVSGYKELKEIKTLVIAGGQSRDDDFLSILHKMEIPVSVTSYQKHTISQILTDRQKTKDRYILLILFDDNDSDGFIAAEALQKAGLTNEYIVLMFTSRDPKGHYARCVDLGIDHLLVKPFSVDELTATISQFFPGIAASAKAEIKKSVKKVPEVLVVDDNQLNRKVVGSLLKVLGIMPDFAESGEEAIEKVRNKTYDIIFMDLIMPVIDGFEASRTILGFDKKMTIIALSADNMPETRTKAEMSGMKELLSKPVSVKDLRAVIDRYVTND
jgi:signal transduction histidine kinase/CheY-like chemotaxis protein